MNMLLSSVLIFLFCFLTPSAVLAASPHTLSFTLSHVTIGQSETKTVPIYLYCRGEKIIGVDVKVKYDPRVLRVVDVTKSDLFENEMAKVIDATAGTVQFSYANSYNVYTTTNGSIALFTFQGRALSESTTITFEYKPGSTKDTNIVNNKAVDILSGVDNMTVSILSASPTTAQFSRSPTTSTSDPTPTKVKLQEDFIKPTSAKKADSKPPKEDKKGSVLGGKTEKITLNNNPVRFILLTVIFGVISFLFIYLIVTFIFRSRLNRERVSN